MAVPVLAQIEFSGYTLSPLQPQYSGQATSPETLITHVIKVQQHTPSLACLMGALPW
jgi:hypothetical protein